MKLSALLLEKYRRQTLVTVILMSLWLFFIAASPRTFLDARIYRSFMSTIPVTTILALGMTFLIVAGEMDMSFPSVSAVSALAFAWLHSPDGGNLPAWFSMLCALTAGGMMGAFNGLLVVRMGIPSIIATIGTQFFWRGAALLLSGGKAIPLSAVRDGTLHRLFVGRTGPWEIPAQSLWALGLAVFLGLMFNRHRYGEAVLFVGDKSSTAEMMGISVARTKGWLFVFMGFLSAFAGVLSTLEMNNWWPTQGDGYMLLVFASVFVGGTSAHGGEGTLFGSFVGSIIIGVIEAGIISTGMDGLWTRWVHGLVIILSMVIYSVLLKGRRRALG